MSRTIEVLRKLQQDHDLFNTPPPPSAVTGHFRPQDGKGSALDLGAVAGEEIRGLVQRLFLPGGTKSPKQVVFCGVDEANGSTWICSQASRSLAAESSLPVCAVDANLHHKALHQYLRVQENRASLVPGNCEFVRPVTQNLWLLCNDSLRDDVDGSSLDNFRSRVGDLLKHFEYVLIDGPPIGSSGDAAVLGQWVDGIVLVLEAHSTRRAAAIKAKQQLDAADVKLLGTVLYNRTFPIPPKIYAWL
jgi:Mrp family chromosome partitioning ATPase